MRLVVKTYKYKLYNSKKNRYLAPRCRNCTKTHMQRRSLPIKVRLLFLFVSLKSHFSLSAKFVFPTYCQGLRIAYDRKCTEAKSNACRDVEAWRSAKAPAKTPLYRKEIALCRKLCKK